MRAERAAGDVRLVRRDRTKRNTPPLGLVACQRGYQRLLRHGDFAAVRDALQIRGSENRFHTETAEGPTLRRAAGLIRRERQHADILEVAVALGIVQAVPDHELVGNLKADVVGLHVFLDAPLRLIEQSGNAQ